MAVKIRLYHLMVGRSSELVRSRQVEPLVPVVEVIRKVMGIMATREMIHTMAQAITAHRVL